MSFCILDQRAQRFIFGTLGGLSFLQFAQLRRDLDPLVMCPNLYFVRLPPIRYLPRYTAFCDAGISLLVMS